MLRIIWGRVVVLSVIVGVLLKIGAIERGRWGRMMWMVLLVIVLLGMMGWGMRWKDDGFGGK
jgi:hypothetical protein